MLSNAGINREDFLADSFDTATGELLPPDLKVLDVNLVGAVYAVKCAAHFFAKRQQQQQTETQCSSCQIVLTGSAASFLDTPPLHLYCASKAGVLGLMRGLRTQLVRRNIVSLFLISLNSLCHLVVIFLAGMESDTCCFEDYQHGGSLDD